MRWVVATLALFALACGANEPEGGDPPADTTGSAEEPATPEEPEEAPEEPAEEPDPEPPPEPEAEPVDIEAGTRLGPVRIGMSLEEVRALGLEEAVVNPRTTAFGPYHVSFRDDAVRRVEAPIGALERIQFGDRVIEAGTHIAEIRDAFGDCVWTEGGGDRYRCAGGTLFVRTTHSMDPQRYTVGVSAR